LSFIKNGGFAAVGFLAAKPPKNPIICFIPFLYFCLFCFIFYFFLLAITTAFPHLKDIQKPALRLYPHF